MLEPKWAESGQEDAVKLEPGMSILKDPYVLNNSEDSVYVRMKILIKDEDGKELDQNEERYQGILRALYLSVQEGNGEAGEEDGSPSENMEDAPLVSQIESKGDGNLEMTLNQSSAFFYEDGWFYYGTDGNEKTYTSLAAGAKTPALFDKLIAPIYKKKAKTVLEDDSLLVYDGVFDTPFTIEIIAQGISAKTKTEEILNKFDTDFTEAKSQ